MSTKILPPNPERLIEGLRDTGYTFTTALADIVDNSIDAGASRVDIVIDMEADGSVFVSVADDGCGMDAGELLDAMTYGAKGRPDPKRLGKFGLGLKTASTAFCRRLSLISRREKGSESQAIWDLDHVAAVQQWEILLDPPQKADIQMLDRTAGDGSGTVVIWTKVDRILDEDDTESGDSGTKSKGARKKKFGRIVDRFRQHAEMTYHRFLDVNDDRARNVVMTLNGSQLEPWDPFCRNESDTEMVAEIEPKAKFDDGDEKFSFQVRAYVLPREEKFSSPEEAARARIKKPGAQGIYIYRENRLIHDGGWLRMYSVEPHYNLLRVEFSFGHEADGVFNVDIKKSRILLNETLFDWLQRWLGAPRKAAEERYRMRTKEKSEKKSPSVNAPADNLVKSHEGELRTWEGSEPAEDGTVTIKNKKGTVSLVLDIAEPDDGVGMTVRGVQGLDDGQMWMPSLIDGRHGVKINMSHPWCARVYAGNDVNDNTLAGIGSLLWALSEAELGIVNEQARRHVEDMRSEVSRLARRLAEYLPEPEDDGQGS